MEAKLKNIEIAAHEEIIKAASVEELENIRNRYLGRKSELTEILKNIKDLSVKERPVIGKQANVIKQKISSYIEVRVRTIGRHARQKKKIDITLPGIKSVLGTVHPITQTIYDICAIFSSLGFSRVEGPEIETAFRNFEALNIPQDHPSRDSFDTFYLEKDVLLRSHTSPVQIRVMEKHQPPLYIVMPGKVYRPDAVDASHSFMFHQVEGLAVDENITFSDLKGALYVFVRKMFGKDTKLRFRPHFFPFTEPSAEVDISCFLCAGKGCRVCSQKGWLEVLGAGMVHPHVFKNVGYDSKKYRGFAFGMGVERIAMLKYGIDDIRLFFENDNRFLKQF
ncbi:MAG: phenylalanine--tRNA ligase subunit alpha [Candidatus Omnitrophota bacterium]